MALALFLGGLFIQDDKKGQDPAPFECGHSRCFTFNQAGDRLFGVTQRGELLYWRDKSAAAPAVTKLEKKPDGDIFDRAPIGAAFNAAGPYVILFYFDGRVQVWDVEAGRKVKDLPNDRRRISYGRRSLDGKLVGCLSHADEGQSCAVLLWNTHDWSPAGRIESNDKINDYCFSPDGKQVVLAVGYSTDRKNQGFTGIVAMDIETKQELGSIEYGSGFPIRIAMSSDGRWIATGGGDAVPSGPNARSLSGHLRIFDWKAKKLATEPYTLHSDYVRAVAFSPDGNRLYSGSYGIGSNGRYQAALRSFSAANNWKEEPEVELGAGNPHEITVAPDGRSVLVPDSDGLQLIDAQSLKVQRTMLKFKFYPEDKEEFDRLRAPKKKKG